MIEQNRAAAEGKAADLAKLLAKGQTWTVGGTARSLSIATVPAVAGRGPPSGEQAEAPSPSAT